MKTKEFLKALENEIKENAEGIRIEEAHYLNDIKISSLEQAIGLFRSLLIWNIRANEEVENINEILNNVMEENDLTEEDIDG